MLEAAENGWGLALILWFQSWRTGPIEAAALVFHVIGSEATVVALLPFIYWCVDTRLGKRLAVFLLISGWINTTAKSALRRPRPYNVSPAVDPVIRETTYGIPSGHAQNATVIGGLFANELHRRWIVGLAVAYAVFTDFSRMILGVHYPHDVLAGVAMGLAMLGLYAGLEPRIGGWVKDRGLWTQIGLVAAVTAALLLIHPLTIPVTSPRWLPESIPIVELLSSPARAAGAFLGAGIGMALESRYLHYDWKGAWKQRWVRLLVGFLGGVALYVGPRMLLINLEPALLTGLVRFALLGFWLAYGAPWLFIKTGLAGQAVRRDPYAEE